MTADPELRRRGRAARDVRRAHREDPVPRRSRGRPRSSCCRSSSSIALAAPTGRVNYWGYQPVSFFAPHAAYASRPGPTAAARRVPRHGQGAPPGRPRGDPRRRLQPHRRGRRRRPDDLLPRASPTTTTTCSTPTTARPTPTSAATGNTFNGNGPIVRRLILDSLRYWVEEMHVDGFRFDLAAVLSRGEDGEPMADPPILWEIETDPVLAGTKLIAEAWDAGGLYQVGSFVGDRWVEWNGRFRDDVRSFMQGRAGQGPGPHPAVPRQPGHLRPQAPRRAGQHQLRDLPRRLHAQRPGLVRRRSTTRRTARTTATATTRT